MASNYDNTGFQSGGLNDSTGRENFEDDGRDLIGQGNNSSSSNNYSGSGAPGVGNTYGDGNLVATTGENQGDRTGFANQTSGSDSSNIGSEHHHHHHHKYENNNNNNQNEFSSTGGDRTGAGYGSNTGSDTYGNDSSDINKGGLTGGFGNTDGERTRIADVNEGDYSKSNEYSSGNNNRQSGDEYNNVGEDRSAGFGRDNGAGNQGVGIGGDSNLNSGPRTGGAAGTDRFDSSSGSDSYSGGASHGQDIGDKRIENDGIGRHGDDFTGGAAATGGAYTNPNTATGLTGRETTNTGVQDQHGESTQSSGGIMSKIKNALGGHNNSANANDSTERDNNNY